MTITAQSSPEMTLQDMDMQARMDPTRAETSYVKGRSLFLKREDAPYRSLVSLESSTYQGLMYRVCHCLSAHGLADCAPVHDLACVRPFPGAFCATHLACVCICTVFGAVGGVLHMHVEHPIHLGLAVGVLLQTFHATMYRSCYASSSTNDVNYTALVENTPVRSH
jgi:hypothetical protein